MLEKVAGDYVGRVKLAKVNSDENAELSSTFGIRSIPNVIDFRDGRPAAQFMGAVPEGEVRAFFEQLLPSASELALARAEAHFAAGSMDEAEKELALIHTEPVTAVPGRRPGSRGAGIARTWRRSGSCRGRHPAGIAPGF